MNTEISLILSFILVLHIAIFIYGWFTARYRPMMLKFSLLENDSERLHSIGMHYQSLVEVPQEFLEAPTPIIIKEAKRIELRLMIEACLVALAGVIPSSLIAVVFG